MRTSSTDRSRIEPTRRDLSRLDPSTPPPDYYLLGPALYTAEQVEQTRRKERCTPCRKSKIFSKGQKCIYYCPRNGCSYALCAVKQQKEYGITGDSETKYQLFVKGAHIHESRRRTIAITPEGRRSAKDSYFFICQLNSREDIEATKRGFLLEAGNSGHSYHRCSRGNDCPFRIRLSYDGLPEGHTPAQAEKAALYVKGEHNHSFQ